MGFSPIWNMTMDLFIHTLYTLSPFFSPSPLFSRVASSLYPAFSMVFTIVSIHSLSVFP